MRHNNNNNGSNRRMKHRSGGGGGQNQGNHHHGGQRKGNVPPRMQVVDSNGPDVRIRGTAWQVHEKYLALSKDAASSGDVVMAESYSQHAEHYQRIINTFNEFLPQHQQQPSSQDMRAAEDAQSQESGDATVAQFQHVPSHQTQPAPVQSQDRDEVRRDDSLGLPSSLFGARPAATALESA